MTRPPTTWVLLANEIKRLEEIANHFAIGSADMQRYVEAASRVSDLILEASERPADKLKREQEQRGRIAFLDAAHEDAARSAAELEVEAEARSAGYDGAK